MERNHVVIGGTAGGQPMLFSHGYGCDQQMWRHVTPAFADFQTVCFDHVGAGRSDLSAYDPDRYETLEGYATDVLEICDALALARRGLRRPLRRRHDRRARRQPSAGA